MTSWLAKGEARARLSRRGWLTGIAAGGVLVATGAVHGVARATVMVEVPFDRLAQEADVIVHGRVLRTGSRLVVDANGSMPHTLTELEIYEPIKGDVGARLFIDEIGGTVQDRGTWIEGTPRYRRGEECIVFLRALPDGHYRTYAMAQGHFEVRPAVPGATPMVIRDTSAMGLVTWVRDTMQLQPGRVASMPLAGFLDYVRDLAEATGGAR